MKEVLVEGPSLVIATEEFKPLLKKKIDFADGTATLPFSMIRKGRLEKVGSWGKHLLLFFTHVNLRVHFLMFGSYRIDKPRPNRVPKLELEVDGHTVYFYSCAIREMPKGFEKEYDLGIDLMSPKWNHQRALKVLRSHPDAMVCDILMDQAVFAGLGNIMKNEILFNRRLHPETKVEDLNARESTALVQEAHRYSWQFYEWKKANILKRNWLIFRKKECPVCARKVKKRKTGVLQRVSHYCSNCQEKKTLPALKLRTARSKNAASQVL